MTVCGCVLVCVCLHGYKHKSKFVSLGAIYVVCSVACGCVWSVEWGGHVGGSMKEINT